MVRIRRNIKYVIFLLTLPKFYAVVEGSWCYIYLIWLQNMIYIAFLKKCTDFGIFSKMIGSKTENKIIVTFFLQNCGEMLKNCFLNGFLKEGN